MNERPETGEQAGSLVQCEQRVMCSISVHECEGHYVSI